MRKTREILRQKWVLFVPLPFGVVGMLLGISALYVVPTELVKARFIAIIPTDLGIVVL